MAYKPIPREKQQLGGLFFSLFAGGITIWQWHTPFGGDLVALGGPILFIMMLGVILFPDPKEERIARGEDISNLSFFQLLTPRWWVVFIVALLAGIVNDALLSLQSGVDLIEVILCGLFLFLFVLYGLAKELGITRQSKQSTHIKNNLTESFHTEGAFICIDCGNKISKNEVLSQTKWVA